MFIDAQHGKGTEMKVPARSNISWSIQCQLDQASSEQIIAVEVKLSVMTKNFPTN